MMAGIQIQMNSEARISPPRPEKNPFTPIGETSMTREGRKNLRLENGLKNATPRPPVVIASSRPWDAAATKTTVNTVPGRERSRPENGTASSASRAAKVREWVKPRCPSGESYGTPAQKPIESTSGRTLAAQASSARPPGTIRRLAAAAIASGTAGWERTDGTSARPGYDFFFAARRFVRGRAAGPFFAVGRSFAFTLAFTVARRPRTA